MSENPLFLSDRPKWESKAQSDFHASLGPDVLAEVLKFMGLQGRVFCRATMAAPWALAIPPDNLAHFHYIERGVCRLRLQKEKEEFTLAAGELAVLPHGSGHLLYDAPGRKTLPIQDLIDHSSHGLGCAIARYGGNGEQTRMICGSFQFRASRENLILAVLPKVMIQFCHTEDTQSRAEAALRFIAAEASQQLPGAEIVLSRMVEILFVQVLRHWLETQREGTLAHWLAALRDDRVAQALSALHGRPEHPWTVSELAKCAHMSRSPFAARFKELVNEPPLTYLKRWRMNLATGLLEDGSLGLKQIASSVGYQSEASFSKAYKEITGFSPGQWRKQYALSSAPLGGFSGTVS
jgi:AraC-like DNA-binding protein